MAVKLVEPRLMVPAPTVVTPALKVAAVPVVLSTEPLLTTAREEAPVVKVCDELAQTPSELAEL